MESDVYNIFSQVYWAFGWTELGLDKVRIYTRNDVRSPP
jgi:hypothetical protein